MASLSDAILHLPPPIKLNAPDPVFCCPPTTTEQAPVAVLDAPPPDLHLQELLQIALQYNRSLQVNRTLAQAYYKYRLAISL